MVSSHFVFFEYVKILDKELGGSIACLLVPEYKFFKTRKWRFDFAIPSLMIAVECDGGTRLKGGGRHNSDSDREKLNAAAVDGWRVLRFSSYQINTNPDYCYKTLYLAIKNQTIHI